MCLKQCSDAIKYYTIINLEELQEARSEEIMHTPTKKEHAERYLHRSHYTVTDNFTCRYENVSFEILKKSIVFFFKKSHLY